MIRLTLDIEVLDDKTDQEELANKLSTEKIAKQVAAYVEAVVVPQISSTAKLKTCGSSAHKHKRGDTGCLLMYESREGEYINEFQTA